MAKKNQNTEVEIIFEQDENWKLEDFIDFVLSLPDKRVEKKSFLLKITKSRPMNEIL